MVLTWMLLLFILVPVVEVVLFIEAGRLIGTVNTIALILLTGVIGGLLVRFQGMRVVRNITNSMQNGRLPADEVVEGLFVLIGGALLLTPGFFTDAIGFSMLLPVSRRIYRELTKKYLKSKIKSYVVRVDVD